MEQVEESLRDHQVVTDPETGERQLKIRSTPSARRADALAMVAESFLEHGPAAVNGGDRNQIVVHVSAETLRHKAAGCCEIEDGPAIAAETVRRIACDASLVALVETEQGEPLT